MTSDLQRSSVARRHLQFGWWSLLCFLIVGFCLELLHAMKIGWYLDVAVETRRLMWTLGHAHGTLLAVVHVVFAIAVAVWFQDDSKLIRWASPCFMAASILLPGGFLLGGIFIYDGDPGVGIFLVPFGAFMLFTAVLLVACQSLRIRRVPSDDLSSE